jgi:hypothetical protein
MRDWRDWKVVAWGAAAALVAVRGLVAAQVLGHVPGQVPAPSAAPTLHIGVTAVEIDAVVTTSRGVGRLQPFTNDKARLKETISRLQISVQGVGIGPDEIDALNAGEMDQSAVDTHKAAADHQKASADFIDEMLRSGSLNAVQNIVRGMRELPGRKSVIFVSDGFALIAHSGGFTQRRPYLMETFHR